MDRPKKPLPAIPTSETALAKPKRLVTSLGFREEDPEFAALAETTGVLMTSFESFRNLAQPTQPEWNKLVYSMDTVLEQVHCGSKEVKVLVRVLEKYVKIQQNCAVELEKVYEKEIEQLVSKDHTPDKLESLSALTRSFLEEIKMFGQAYAQHSVEVESNVLLKMKALFLEHKAVHREVLEEMKVYQKDLEAVKSNVSSKKTKALRMMEAMESKSGGGPIGFSKLISKAAAVAETRLFNGSANPFQRAYEIRREYEDAVNEAQYFTENIVQREFPRFLSTLEEAELMRHYLCRTVLSDFQTSVVRLSDKIHVGIVVLCFLTGARRVICQLIRS